MYRSINPVQAVKLQKGTLNVQSHVILILKASGSLPCPTVPEIGHTLTHD